MQCSPHDIKEQLVRALDQDHNVVDMAAVLNCISMLEAVSMRREDLERTRLGRLINELRKKTSDIPLQKRAKDLVRSWRKLLDENPTPSSNGTVQKSSSPAQNGTPQINNARVAQLQLQSHGRTTSPALSSSLSNSPVLRTRNGSGFKPVSPAVPGSPSPSAVVPLASHPGSQSSTPASTASRIPNKHSVANKRLRKAESPPESAKRSRVTNNGFDSLLNNNSNSNAIPSGNSAFESIVRPDSRTGSVHSDDTTSNGGISTPRIVPKVKTTQQLIDELKAKSGINVSIDDVVKEPAPPERNVNPAISVAKGKRGRLSHHARDSPPVASLARQAAVNNANFNKLLNNSESAHELSQTKSELMDRFLQSSPQSHSDESNPPTTNGHGPSNGTPMTSYVDVEEDIRKIMSQLPPVASYSVENDDGEPVFPPRTSAPTEAEVDRISNGQWPCVNGNYDMNGQWRPWNELMMAKSVGEEPLPVLPYVDIDW